MLLMFYKTSKTEFWYNARVGRSMPMTETKLKPTYWRTCRALANEDRLRLFKAVAENDGRLSVRDYARMLGLQEDVASVYLRHMNSRGLLGVSRHHIKVMYNVKTDRSLPQSAELQKVLLSYVRNDPPAGWEDSLVRLFKGFTHFNRLAMIIRLAEGEATLEDLNKSVGTMVKSLYHHMRFLYGAGLVEEHRLAKGLHVYRLKPQTNPVARVLLKHVLEGVKDGERYYNPKVAKPDSASRAVLKKIRREEGTTASNWKQRRGTGVGSSRLSAKAQKAVNDFCS